MSLRRSRGFTLIELMIVVAILGLLAAIGIWNYLIALERAKQKKSMADMRSIAVAWESRASDVSNYSAPAFGWPSQSVSYTGLASALTPTYLRSFPRADAWGKDFDFATSPPVVVGNSQAYAIRSRGRDSLAEGASYAEGATTNFDCDIVYSNGMFVVYPEVSNK